MNADPRGGDFLRRGKLPPPSLGFGLRITKRVRTALAALLQSSDYARDLNRSEWDFAVEISVLRKAGLNHSDLRWLICKGFVDHAYEVAPQSEEEGRSFRDAPKLTFSRSSCFVVKGEGIPFIHQVLNLEVSPPLRKHQPPEFLNHHLVESPLAEIQLNEPNDNIEELIPVWDRDRQELRVGNQVVKQFKAPAPNQELILSVFQEDGWPVRIDDPLPPNGSRDPKRRLHDTINSLNRCHKVFMLRFLGDGRASGIRWELVPRN